MLICLCPFDNLNNIALLLKHLYMKETTLFGVMAPLCQALTTQKNAPSLLTAGGRLPDVTLHTIISTRLYARPYLSAMLINVKQCGYKKLEPATIPN